jgi:hypothetical protein
MNFTLDNSSHLFMFNFMTTEHSPSFSPAPEEEVGMERVTLVLSVEVVRKIDEFWHTRRLRSRSAAVRELLALGFERLAGDFGEKL